jgi:aminoglycoside N3'-acetyltransferase
VGFVLRRGSVRRRRARVTGTARNLLARFGRRGLAYARAKHMNRTLLQLERAQIFWSALNAAKAVRIEEAYPIPLGVLAETLGELGIRRGDLVHFQSSVSHLYRGSREKTAERTLTPAAYAARVVDLLVDVVGSEGTIVMNTDSLTRADVRRAWAGLIDPDRPLFDFRTAPTNRGLIAELFRRRRGVVRSVHPWYNMAALGPRADELMSDHERSSPYTMDRHSPTYKLTMLEGKVVLLGRSFVGNTPLHLVEYLYPDEFPRPIFLDRPVIMTYVAASGSTGQIDVMLHALGWYVGSLETIRFCEYLDEKYGLYRRRRFDGDAEIVAYNAQDQYEATFAEMRAGVTLYDPQFA